jgi:hypothetical protein
VSATACVAVAAEQLNLIVISSVCIRLFDKDIRQIIRLKSVLLLHPKIKTSNWMNAFWLLVSCWLNCVLTQPLELAQYTALMTVYDALGSSHADEVKSFCRSLFGFFRAGCNATLCPRFNASSNCIGSGLICSGGKVTRLCVLASDVWSV